MRRFFMTFIILLLLPAVVFAEDTDKDQYNEYLRAYDFSFFEDELSGDTYDYLEELGVANFDFDTISSLSFLQVVGIIKDMFQKGAKSPVSGALGVLIYIIISAFIRSMKADDGSPSGDTFSTASALIISVMLVASVGRTVSLCGAAMGIAGSFIYAFIPVFCAIVLASGGGVTAFSTNSMLLLLAQGISFISSHVFMPAVNSFLALGICSGLRSELRLDKLISSLKSVIIWCISFISGAFVSVLSIKTAITGRADVLGVRSARFVINSVVPVIGASISEGLLSIQTYSSLIKSSVGIVGIIAVAFVFLPAICEVMMWRIMLSLCSIVADIFDDSSVSLVLTAFRDTMLLTNVILILSAVTTIISIGLLIAAGG